MYVFSFLTEAYLRKVAKYFLLKPIAHVCIIMYSALWGPDQSVKLYLEAATVHCPIPII